MPADAIMMPKLGLTMTEGVLTEWMVAPGDAVKPGDVLFVVETDKISNEIESTDEGVIEALHVAAGDLVAVGAVVATFVGGESGSSPEPVPQARLDTAPDPVHANSVTSRAPVIEEERIIATPLARRMATKAGLNLSAVSGSGPRGRIMAADIASALEKQPRAPEAHVPAPVADRLSASQVALEIADEVVPLNPLQKVVARRLSEAKRDIPHFYVFAEADVTQLLDLREELNHAMSPVKVSVNHFIVTAVARALDAMPEVNRVWAEAGHRMLRTADVGIAVEGPKGLLAPVLRDLGSCGVVEVAKVAMALVETARSGRLAAEEMQGGSISVSNVGMFGATGLIPIVNPGQSSILGVGRTQGVFRPNENDEPVLRHVLNLALSCDHRVIDGALAARFINQIQKGLESPLGLVCRI